MDPMEEAGFDVRAQDPFDRWVVRFPKLRRAARAHRVAIGVVCLVLVAALITPLALSLLARRGPAGPSAADAATTTTTAKRTTTTTTTTQPSATNAYPDSSLTNAALQPTSGAADTPAGLTSAGAAPPPAPDVAAAPALKQHEVFDFAPYWTLADESGFDVQSITTIAYFSVGVNPNGSLSETGPGWTGYLSERLADLVTRAHAAGDHVVLTVSDFDPGSLDLLTSSPTAPGTLATALAYVLNYRHLDGVNFDLEPQDTGARAGLTNLVTRVSGLLKQADPHFQVTMDTPADAASSGAGATGPYDLTALAPAVDAFFVTAYAPNIAATSSSTSPLTSTLLSDKATVQAYTAQVPAAKVILGLPAFGVDWPTTNGTLRAQATGPATTTTLGDLLSSGDPRYWDATTQSGWTSYRVGAQWHETFFESPTSFYLAAHVASGDGLAGVGLWALGLDADDPSDLSALLGFPPAVWDGPAGPTTTSSSPPASTTTASSAPATVASASVVAHRRSGPGGS